MRLFVAINLPGDLRKDIHVACEPLRGTGLPIRWTRAEAYHLTLKFLGAVDPTTSGVLRADLDGAGGLVDPFALELDGFGAFPAPGRPRVVWIGVRPTEPLETLYQAVEAAMVRRGFDPATRAFRPHITLGRARDRARAGLGGLREPIARLNYRATFQVRTVDLMESHLSPRGARYSAVHRTSLSKGRT